MTFSFVVTFKNREEKRIRLFLDSLKAQTVKDFELIFVNQGSDEPINNWVEKVVAEYNFITYIFNCTEGYLWNKSNAINIGIKVAKGKNIIIADIDLVFLEDYLEKISTHVKDGSFITHSVLYSKEKVILNKLSELSNIKDYSIFTEAFNGACVASREILIKIRGYDEYYLVWGVEDDDIIKNLENEGELRIQLNASEIPIFHQWHPSIGYITPYPWYLTMVDHLFSVKRTENFGKEWGAMFTAENRPALIAVKESLYTKYKQLSFIPAQPLYFFNAFIEGFNKLEKNENAYCEYSLCKKIVKKTSFNFLKKLFIKLPSIDVHDENSIRSFFQTFIGTHRHLIQDYYYQESENNFLFVVIKK